MTRKSQLSTISRVAATTAATSKSSRWRCPWPLTRRPRTPSRSPRSLTRNSPIGRRDKYGRSRFGRRTDTARSSLLRCAYATRGGTMCQFYVCAIAAPSTERASFEQNAPTLSTRQRRRAVAVRCGVSAVCNARCRAWQRDPVVRRWYAQCRAAVAAPHRRVDPHRSIPTASCAIRRATRSPVRR